MGGPSAEREVSLRSGRAVAQGLREAGYRVAEIVVDERRLDMPSTVDGVFIALHGEFGEDGQVQRLLEERRLPYTGSGPEASRKAFDKRLSKQALAGAGIRTPAGEIVRPGETGSLPLPAVVKPACQGSSLGVSLVFDESERLAALRNAWRYGDAAIVEAFVAGRELTVGIVGERTLPVVEILAGDGWYDYGAKYVSSRTRYEAPASLASAETRACRRAALQTFRALGCRGFARVDLRLSGQDRRPYVLELNSIPGFTASSLLPKAAAVSGCPFARLCDRIMRLATLDGGERRLDDVAG